MIVGFWRWALLWLRAVRAPFFTATLVPVLLGAAIAGNRLGPGEPFPWGLFGWILIGALTAHAATNLLNDYGDHRSGTWFAKTVAEFAGLAAPPEVSRDEAEATFSDSRLSFLRESRTVDTTRMRDVLGVSPRYANCEDGIRESLS